MTRIQPSFSSPSFFRNTKNRIGIAALALTAACAPSDGMVVVRNTPEAYDAIASMPGKLTSTIDSYSTGDTWQADIYSKAEGLTFSSGERRTPSVTCTYLKPNQQRLEGPLLSVTRKTSHFRNDTLFVVEEEDITPAITKEVRTLCDQIRTEIRALPTEEDFPSKLTPGMRYT